MKAEKIRIVIVEDNAADLGLLMRHLKKAKFDKHVKVISDGKAAFEWLSGGDQPGKDLIAVFLDLSLPSISGLRVLEMIRSNEGTRHLPVIVMTGSVDPEDLNKCRQLGVSCYVQKPITVATFTKAVADIFHSPAT